MRRFSPRAPSRAVLHALLAAPLVVAAVTTMVGCASDPGPRPIPDDFCHGEADGTPCDDGDPCTLDDRCGLGVCEGRPALDCSALDGPCVVGTCAPVEGEAPGPDGHGLRCVPAPRPDGTACDDGLACTDADACVAGLCHGAPRDCAEAAGPCELARCDPDTGGCVTEPAPVGAACDDGDPCTVEDTCAVDEVGAVTCVGAPKDCATPEDSCLTGACDPETGACVQEPVPEGGPCDDGNPCTTGEVCAGGVCGGAVEAADGTPCALEDLCVQAPTCQSGACLGAPRACPPPGECKAPVCDPATGACGAEDLPDGTPCDDRDPCTVGEVCTAGSCGGGENTCFCVDKPDGTPCDDGQKCTANDECAGGSCLGVPVDCGSVGDGVCLEGACLPETGECVVIPAAVGTVCDDGDPCTTGDACIQGACLGSPKDCAGVEDTCNVAACDPATGACLAVPLADGLPCDDGDPCTGADRCTAGTCAGTTDACGACEGLVGGAPCTTSDGCAPTGLCVMVGDVLRCEAAPLDCSAWDSACTVGVCDPTTGSCGAAPRPDGGACDDGDPCTQGDTCAAGTCQGAPVPMCGAQVQACEPYVPNEEQAGAVPIVLPDGAATGLVTVQARIDTPADTDWWRLVGVAGKRVTVTTGPHCGSELDTLLGVYGAPSGTLLGEDDNGGAGAWAKVTDLEPGDDDAVLIGVTAYDVSGVGTYLLTIKVEEPPPCKGDLDCGCPDLLCSNEPSTKGQCVPQMPGEVEPNDGAGAAQVLPPEGELHATLAAPGDVDWFAATAEAGVPLKLSTRTFCPDQAGATGGGAVQTELTVFDATGATVLASAQGGGPQGHALIDGFLPPAAGTYLVRVRSVAATFGPYVVSVQQAVCAEDVDCGCEDQQCVKEPGLPPLCEPKLTEGGGATPGEPTPLELGQRMHGAVSVPYEVDRYQIALGAGDYAVETLPYCGSTTDTTLRIFAPSDTGEPTLLGQDDDGGAGFFAAVASLHLDVVTVLDVRVSGNGPATGDYVLRVTPVAAP